MTVGVNFNISTFYGQLLRMQILKAPKKTDNSSFFVLLGSARIKAAVDEIDTSRRYLQEVISLGLTIRGKLQSSGCLKGMRQLHKCLFRF